MAVFKHNDFCPKLVLRLEAMYEACGQDKNSASIQPYDVMVACSNSKELCPYSFRRRKGFMTRAIT